MIHETVDESGSVESWLMRCGCVSLGIGFLCPFVYFSLSPIVPQSLKNLRPFVSLLICPSAYFALSVFVYNIPPRPSNRGYRASDWKLDAPDFTGRLKVVSRGEKLFIKIEDKVSGELFAQCPIEEYPGLFIIRFSDELLLFIV